MASVLYRGIPDQFGHGPHRFDLVRCKVCGLVRTQPRPSRETIGAYYPPDYAPYQVYEGKDRRALYRRLLRRVSEYPYRVRHGAPLHVEPPPGGAARMLDVGVGDGSSLREYSQAGWEVWGVEPSPEAAASAASRAGVPAEHVIQAPAEEVSLPPESFDLIRLSHVVEHLHDPRRVIAKARLWLRPGGRVIAICPNFASWERRLFRRRWMQLDVPRHLNHFTPDTLLALLGSEGLAVRSMRPELEFMTLPGSVLNTMGLRPKGGVAYRALFFGLMPFTCLARALDTAAMEVVAEAAAA